MSASKELADAFNAAAVKSGLAGRLAREVELFTSMQRITEHSNLDQKIIEDSENWPRGKSIITKDPIVQEATNEILEKLKLSGGLPEQHYDKV